MTSECWILTLVQRDVSSLGDDSDPKISFFPLKSRKQISANVAAHWSLADVPGIGCLGNPYLLPTHVNQQWAALSLVVNSNGRFKVYFGPRPL